MTQHPIRSVTRTRHNKILVDAMPQFNDLETLLQFTPGASCAATGSGGRFSWRWLVRLLFRGAVELCISPANSRVPLDPRLFSRSFLFPFFFDVPCR